MKRLLIGLLALAACKEDKPRPPWQPPIQPPVIQGCGSGWTVNPLVNGQQYGPTSCSQDGHFVVPACPAQPQRTDGMHTLVRPSGGPLPPGGTITVDFEVTGADNFVGAQEQGSAAYVSLFIQRAGDNWSGTGPYNEYRAYSVNVTPSFTENLGNGRYQLSQQLVSSQWVNVSAPGTEQGFQELLQNAERVGITFGTAQSGRAHGVCTGNASTQFVLHSFTVQ
jgi:hypothetical protein